MSQTINKDFTPWRFKAWIGSEYEKQKFRVFILGESFIDNGSGKPEDIKKKEDNADNVIRILNEVITKEINNKVFRSYNNMFRIIYNKSTLNKELTKNWENFAFTNFIEKYVTIKKNTKNIHKKNIKTEDLEKAREALPKHLGNLSPDLTIVWGKSKMKNKWFPAPNKKTKIQELNIENFYKYTFDEKTYYIWFIHHPSYFKNREKQHNDYKKLEKYIVENKIINK